MMNSVVLASFLLSFSVASNFNPNFNQNPSLSSNSENSHSQNHANIPSQVQHPLGSNNVLSSPSPNQFRSSLLSQFPNPLLGQLNQPIQNSYTNQPFQNPFLNLSFQQNLPIQTNFHNQPLQTNFHNQPLQKNYYNQPNQSSSSSFPSLRQTSHAPNQQASHRNLTLVDKIEEFNRILNTPSVSVVENIVGSGIIQYIVSHYINDGLGPDRTLNLLELMKGEIDKVIKNDLDRMNTSIVAVRTRFDLAKVLISTHEQTARNLNIGSSSANSFGMPSQRHTYVEPSIVPPPPTPTVNNFAPSQSVASLASSQPMSIGDFLLPKEARVAESTSKATAKTRQPRLKKNTNSAESTIVFSAIEPEVTAHPMVLAEENSLSIQSNSSSLQNSSSILPNDSSHENNKPIQESESDDYVESHQSEEEVAPSTVLSKRRAASKAPSEIAKSKILGHKLIQFQRNLEIEENQKKEAVTKKRKVKK